MITLLKSNLERLESTAVKAKTDLDKVASQHEAATIHAAGLSDLVAAAFTDAAENAGSLEGQLFQAESRVRSLSAAVTLAEQRLAKAEKELADARAKAKAETAAATMETAAGEFEKAIKAVRQVMPALATAMDGTSFTSIATLNQHARFLATHIHQFNGILKPGGDIEKWVSDLRVRAELVRGGGVSADIGKTEAENQRERAEALKRLAS